MAKPDKGRRDPDMDDEDMTDDAPTVTLVDEQGRSLVCYVEKSMNINDQNYALLMPVDVPVQIFAWEPDDNDEDTDILVDIEDEEIDDVFSTARAVLAEQDLTLNRTALTLTATGDLPEPNEEDIITLEIGEEEEEDTEQFQKLADFFYEEQEYAVCTPFDPLLFFARIKSNGQPELLSPEEFQEIRTQLEDQLFDELE